MRLTVPGHADGETLPEPAVLAAITIQSYHQTLAVTKTPVLDLLLYTSSEESLKQNYNDIYSLSHHMCAYNIMI